LVSSLKATTNLLQPYLFTPTIFWILTVVNRSFWILSGVSRTYRLRVRQVVDCPCRGIRRGNTPVETLRPFRPPLSEGRGLLSRLAGPDHAARVYASMARCSCRPLRSGWRRSPAASRRSKGGSAGGCPDRAGEAFWELHPAPWPRALSPLS